MGCNQLRNGQSSEPSKEPPRSETGLKVLRERPAIVPALEETIFINADLVLVFPGNLEGVDDKRDRVPQITKDGGESWQDLGAVMEWSSKAKRVSTLHSGTLVQALW